MHAERRTIPSFQRALSAEHHHQYSSAWMESDSRAGRRLCTIFEGFFSIRWVSMWMFSSRIVWKELRVSITHRWNIWRNTRMASDHAPGESLQSAEIWRCDLPWDTTMWFRFRCVVLGLARDFWRNSTLLRRFGYRELWSVGNESMWWKRRICMYEWNVYCTRILPRWRPWLSRLVRWTVIQERWRVSRRKFEYRMRWSPVSI